MQQASRPITSAASAAHLAVPPAASSPRFVINLCSSTTPVALVQPSHAGLKRFTFFVSRRLEEGRERFRLHMGYFDSQQEAENILDLVRDVYPAAWAGVAPGIKLRARAASREAAAPATAAASASSASAASAPAAVPVAAIPAAALPERAVTPAAAIATAQPATASAALPAAAQIPTVTAAPAAASAATPPATLKLELVPDQPRAMPTTLLDDSTAAARSLTKLRATISSLDDAAPSAPAADTVPRLEGAAVLRLLESAAPANAVKPPAAIAPAAKAPAEMRPAARTPAANPPAAKPPAAKSPAAMSGNAAQPAVRSAAAPLPGARLAPAAEPALFAVQLLWSVQPIDMSRVPQLAIFSAYTLYGAEGNRDGRRWYGLRLGFFTDAVSAKQVAQYVRSEFTSVSVVPVTARERTRAGAVEAKPLPAPSSARSDGPELKFIEDVHTDTATSGSRPALKLPEPTAAVRAAMAAVGVSDTASGGKRVKLRVGQGAKPVSKRPAHNRPLSLEETLEILGAGDLELEKARGERLNDASRRERKPRNPGGTRFGRLINRLAERLGNP